MAEHLRYVRIFTLANDDCKKRHNATEAVKISETSLCAFKTHGAGTCFGDSGGPLAAKQTLIGLVSWGIPCAQGKPDMFTRISSYVDWIVQETGLEVN